MRLAALVLPLLFASALASPAWSQATSPAAQTAAIADAEGLVKVKVRGLQTVYALPGAKLAGYDKVMLDPIEVSFAKSWEPQTGGQRISATDKQEIREGLERVLREAFTKELTKSERYTVVNAPGDDVLRIKAEIRDLYINAPDVPSATITHSYTLSAGEMTLVAELRDSATGALIARVIDRKKDPEKTWLELTTRVDNVAAAQQAAASWARTLRERLDSAHGIGDATAK
jgi:hypothetical protein